MATLFTLLGFVSFICLVIGLVNPALLARIVKKPMTRGRALKVFGSALFVSIVVIAIASPSQPTPSNDVVDANDAKAQVAEVEDSKFPSFKNGQHAVGTDIQPGTYRTRTASGGCYFARLSGFDGSLDEIISNTNTGAPAVITIEPTDKGFQSTRCGTWTQDLSRITESMTTFGDGTYIVGTDIEAGTYKNQGGDGCYYSRLSGFGGTLGNILANENTNDVAIVTIRSTDKGFTSSRCGTWTKTN